ncbi:MFS general substrate transporter [Mytilinidion resinicola]|uniref:MFS general substrate transporter n=1 Tax=Mytilinidion resinicola TaxID=574789 RepID=A0A6A6Z0X9_9PEZI|nr:MFS general substrate transporter [Mytilinidion resinicola]KAF2814751.1 MFS general substrate transporter [Mytilinidion resinicola]
MAQEKTSLEKAGHLEYTHREDGVAADAWHHGVDAEKLPTGYFRSSFFLGTMLASGLSVSAGVGGFALAAPLLATINAEIGPDPDIVWVALVYTMTLAIGQALVGRLSDIFGRRWFFIGGSFLALIGCIISAVAHNVPALVGGTALIGFVAASQLSYTFVLGELVPFKFRFMSLGFVYIWAIPFSGFGPALSYALVQHPGPGWRSCYYPMIVINAAATPCWFLFYHPPTFHMKYADRKSRLQVVKDLDFIGLILFIGGLLIFLMGRSWGGSSFMPLKKPLVPMHLFRNMKWVSVVMLVVVGASVYYAFAIIWPTIIFMLYISGLTYGGWLACVTRCAINTGQVSGGWLSKHVGRQKWQLVACSIASCAMLGAAGCATPNNKNTIIGLLFVGCFFIGWLESVGLAMTGIVIDDQNEIGTAVDVAGSIRSAVSTVASTLYTVVLTNRLEKTIPAVVPPALVKAGLPVASVPSFLSAITVGTPAAFAAVDGLTDAIELAGITAYKPASSQAYRTVMLVTIAFLGLGLFFSFWAPNVDELMTNRVSQTLHKRKDENVVGA